MQLLITIVCVYVGFRILVALGTRFPPIATLLRALFLWLLRPLEILAYASADAGYVCLQGYQSRLHLPPQRTQGDIEADSPLLNLISRLVMFVGSLSIIIGDLELARYRQVTLFHLLLTTKADIPFQDYAAAAMWVCASMIFGFFLTEALGLVPKGVHVLTMPSKWLRFLVGFVSALLLIGSIALMALFYGYGQAVIEQLSDNPDLAIDITMAFGVVMGSASVGALWLIKIGLSAVLCLVCGGLYCFCSGLHLLWTFLAGCIESFVTVTPTHTTQPLASIVDESPFPLVIETDTQEKLPMAKEKRDITLSGFGSYAYRMIATLARVGQQHGVGPYILQGSILDLSRSYAQTGSLSLGPNTKNIAPPITEIHYSQANEMLDSAYTKLATTIFNTAVENTHIKHTGTTIVVCDFHLLPAIAPALRTYKNRLSKNTVILLMQQPTAEEYRRYNDANDTLVDLQSEPDRVIETCILTSPMSEGTLRNGMKTSDEAIAQPIMNMCIAPLHAQTNVTVGEAFIGISGSAPYAGVSVAVAPVATKHVSPAWQFFKLFAPKAGDKGLGDYEDLLAGIKHVTKEVLTNTATCMTLATPDLTLPRVIVYSVPLHTTDVRYSELCDFIHYYTNTTYPGTTTIVTQANGTAFPNMKPGYKVQATCLFPTSHLVPQSAITQTAVTTQTTVTPQQTEETTPIEVSLQKKSNGHRRAIETP